MKKTDTTPPIKISDYERNWIALRQTWEKSGATNQLLLDANTVADLVDALVKHQNQEKASNMNYSQKEGKEFSEDAFLWLEGKAEKLKVEDHTGFIDGNGDEIDWLEQVERDQLKRDRIEKDLLERRQRDEDGGIDWLEQMEREKLEKDLVELNKEI